MQDNGRREFLRGAIAAPIFLPAGARGGNDRIVIGLIGAGLRGTYVGGVFVELGCPLGGICDIYEPNLAEAAKKLGGQPALFNDYRRLLERKDIDAVCIATPEHLHAPMLKAALAAGKDVYLEKPLSHSITEGVEMVRAVRATRQIVQIGMHRRSAPAILEAKRLVDQGILGKVSVVRAQWKGLAPWKIDNSPLPGKLDWDRFLGPATRRPMEPARFRAWRLYRDYSGGLMVDQGAHAMDIVQWFTNSGTPSSAICQGNVYAMIGSETPDFFSAVFEYQTMSATWTLNYSNNYESNWRVVLEGSKATMVHDIVGYRVYPEPYNMRNPVASHDVKYLLPADPHVRNFLDCVRSRQEPNAPVEVGHAAVCGPHLANIAYRAKRMAILNPEATEAY